MSRSLFPENPSRLDEAEALVALSLVPGIGPSRIRALITAMGGAAAVFRVGEADLSRVPGIGPATARAIRSFQDFGAVRDQLARAKRLGARLVASSSTEYPALLRQTYDHPPFLWVRGRLRAEDEHAVAVVGTRRPTDYGSRVTRGLAADLARAGITVVSGLAYGVDVLAHRAALEAGGRTIAVLGSGVDRIYPGHHARLAGEIVQNGALVSEFPMGTAPDAPNFPRRNRLISGISLGTLVVEAFATGGALITAREALDQNREVFAVPAAIDNDAGRGTNQLIRDSQAKLTTCVEDVLVELGLEHLVPPSSPEARREPLSAQEQRIYDALTDQPAHVDLLCERIGEPPALVLAHLLSLEIKAYVRQLPGKNFIRI